MMASPKGRTCGDCRKLERRELLGANACYALSQTIYPPATDTRAEGCRHFEPRLSAVSAHQEGPAAEDPRDALLKRCATELWAAAVRHWGKTGVGLRDHEQDCSECRSIYALLDSLRAAGVEPES